MPTAKIQVSLDHIRHGKRADVWGCFLALAFQDAGFHRPSIIGNAYVDMLDGSRHCIELPHRIREDIANFDARGPVFPSTLEISYHIDCHRVMGSTRAGISAPCEEEFDVNFD